MAYEQPLAYALGLEGLALLRAFAGEHDREFTETRIAEIRRLLDNVDLTAGVTVEHVDTVAGYGIWAETYDGPNPAFDFDEPAVRELAASLPPGTALDAACGTGRIAAVLAGCGHRVVGVDSSPDMLAHARKRLPQAEFHVGDLHRLPVADASADLVTCSLALCHVPDPRPVLHEFARVLRPGGHALITDVHPEQIARTHLPTVRRPDGTPARLRTYHHRVGDQLRAALSAGFAVHRCDEPLMPAPAESPTDAPGSVESSVPTAPAAASPTDPGPWEAWPWSLATLVPEAAHAAAAGVPAVIRWHLRKEP
ncbi:class I SAM-dependent methyltransferase [Nocardia blacklockiae]|uniref:class I SAM-dependent methyltransferase n=1 Tax=Nocardia blacklockiae TaxID=480036 RepID=UPI001896180F|nr:class I SAM-dependent methyltransferase [Nocardia blacklockiae]MBF6172860.1 class I SAM-dependent methyltransferase [Nocardia blacklockiae]